MYLIPTERHWAFMRALADTASPKAAAQKAGISPKEARAAMMTIFNNKWMRREKRFVILVDHPRAKPKRNGK